MLLSRNQKEIILGTDNGEICIWDIVANKCQTTFLPDPLGGPIYSIAMNSEGTSLAAVNSGGFLLYWSVVSQEGISLSEKQRAKVHTAYALKVQFSPDSTLLVTCGADNAYNVIRTASFDIAHRQSVVVREGRGGAQQRWVWDCAFSADSRYLLTASSDGLARLWHLERKEERFAYRGHKRAVTCMAFRDRSLEDIEPVEEENEATDQPSHQPQSPPPTTADEAEAPTTPS